MYAAQIDNPVHGRASTCLPSTQACMYFDLPHRANVAQSKAGVKPRSYFSVPLQLVDNRLVLQPTADFNSRL